MFSLEPEKIGDIMGNICTYKQELYFKKPRISEDTENSRKKSAILCKREEEIW